MQLTNILIILVWSALVLGWILNIVQLATNTYTIGFTLVKAAGIFIAPLGSILGFIG